MERPLGALRQDGLLGKVGCGQLDMASSELRDSGTHGRAVMTARSLVVTGIAQAVRLI